MIARLRTRLARMIAGPQPITGPERVALDAMRRVQARTTNGCRAQARQRHPSSTGPRVAP